MSGLIQESLLLDDPLEAIVNIINSKYSLNLKPKLVKIVEIESIGGPNIRLTIDYPLDDATTNNIKPLHTNSFILRRLNLANVNPNRLIIKSNDLPIADFENFKQLFLNLGILITLDDFEDVLIDEYDTPFLLKAKDTSLRFYGETYIKLIRDERVDIGNYSIDTFPEGLLTDTILIGTRQNADVLTYGYDFTKYREYLIGLRPDNNALPYPTLLRVLKSVTDIDFVFNNIRSPYNLTYNYDNGVYSYKIVYNGRTNLEHLARKDMDNVLILEINSSLNTNLSGNLYIHYN